MDVQYSADIAHIDDFVKEAARERPGKPIRLRVQPTVFRAVEPKGQQRAWPAVDWDGWGRSRCARR